jgi:ABC-type glycerol-3-phosphate transport system substrate-binding protein
VRRTRVVLLAIVLVVALAALAGCAGQSKAAADKERCFANEALIGAEMKLFTADAGIQAPIQDVVTKLHAECPSGGTYSYDATTGVVTCSIHGHP